MVAIGAIALIYDGTASQGHRPRQRHPGPVPAVSPRHRDRRPVPAAESLPLGCTRRAVRTLHRAGVRAARSRSACSVAPTRRRALAADRRAVGRLPPPRAVAPDAACQPRPSFWTILIDTAAAVLVVGGLQAVIVQLLPTRFVNGENILKWSRAGWLSLLAVAMTLYMVFVVRPEPGPAVVRQSLVRGRPGRGGAACSGCGPTSTTASSARGGAKRAGDRRG